MKLRNYSLILVIATLAVGWSTLALAQIPSISMSRGPDGKMRTFLAGELSIGGDISPVDNKTFTCATVQPLKKGDKIAARTSDDQAWSADKFSFKIGDNTVAYPVMAMVKCSDGNFQVLFAAKTTIKVDMKAGEVIHSEGFSIEAKRAIKAGETIPTILIGDSPISIEADSQAQDSKAKPKPFLTIFKDDAKKEDRALALEAWGVCKANSE
jgi:hypothetical protein